MADSDSLAIGAAAIAERCFDDKLSVKQVYRLPQEGGWPIFKIRGKLSMRPSAARAEIERREQAALAAPAAERRAPRPRERAKRPKGPSEARRSP
jgi:hypothetical protein